MTDMGLLRDTQAYKEKGNSHEFPNPIFVNLKSNTIMKKPHCKGTTVQLYPPNYFR